MGREGEVRGWSDFGGKLEKKDKSFLAAFQRELSEKGVKVYKVSPDVLYTQSPILHMHKLDVRQIVYAFCRCHVVRQNSLWRPEKSNG